MTSAAWRRHSPTWCETHKPVLALDPKKRMKPIIRVENLGKQYRIGRREARLRDPPGVAGPSCRFSHQSPPASAQSEWEWLG